MAPPRPTGQPSLPASHTWTFPDAGPHLTNPSPRVRAAESPKISTRGAAPGAKGTFGAMGAVTVPAADVEVTGVVAVEVVADTLGREGPAGAAKLTSSVWGTAVTATRATTRQPMAPALSTDGTHAGQEPALAHGRLDQPGRGHGGGQGHGQAQPEQRPQREAGPRRGEPQVDGPVEQVGPVADGSEPPQHRVGQRGSQRSPTDGGHDQQAGHEGVAGQAALVEPRGGLGGGDPQRQRDRSARRIRRPPRPSAVCAARTRWGGPAPEPAVRPTGARGLGCPCRSTRGSRRGCWSTAPTCWPATPPTGGPAPRRRPAANP